MEFIQPELPFLQILVFALRAGENCIVMVIIMKSSLVLLEFGDLHPHWHSHIEVFWALEFQ